MRKLKKSELLELHRRMRERLSAGETAVVSDMVARGLDLGELIDSTTALLVAVQSRNYSECEALLDAGVYIEAPKYGGETALMAAVVLRDVRMVKFLIERGAMAGRGDSFGRTALHKACLEGEPQLVEILLGARPSARAKNSNGETALHVAALNGHATVCELLLQHGAGLEEETTGCATALHLAASFGQLPACKVLLAHGASREVLAAPPERNDRSSLALLTPFQSAVYMGHSDVARFFVTEVGEDLAQRTLAGRTLLQIAPAAGDIRDVLRSLKTELAVADSCDNRAGRDRAPAVRNHERKML